jgi:hypothetical protein
VRQLHALKQHQGPREKASPYRREGNVSRNEGSRLILILAAEASAVLALSRLRLHGLQLRTHHEFEKGVPGGRKRQHH